MAKFIAKTRGFMYPADAGSLAIVTGAGGASKASHADLARVRWRRVEIGGDVSDMPTMSLLRYLSRGDIEEVSDTSPVAKPEEARHGR